MYFSNRRIFINKLLYQIHHIHKSISYAVSNLTRVPLISYVSSKLYHLKKKKKPSPTVNNLVKPQSTRFRTPILITPYQLPTQYYDKSNHEHRDRAENFTKRPIKGTRATANSIHRLESKFISMLRYRKPIFPSLYATTLYTTNSSRSALSRVKFIDIGSIAFLPSIFVLRKDYFLRTRAKAFTVILSFTALNFSVQDTFLNN